MGLHRKFFNCYVFFFFFDVFFWLRTPSFRDSVRNCQDTDATFAPAVLLIEGFAGFLTFLKLGILAGPKLSQRLFRNVQEIVNAQKQTKEKTTQQAMTLQQPQIGSKTVSQAHTNRNKCHYAIGAK